MLEEQTAEDRRPRAMGENSDTNLTPGHTGDIKEPDKVCSLFNRKPEER